MVRALIYGTGSVGSIYGYILHKAGVEVIAICRSNHSEVIKNGISIKSELWGDVKYQPRAVRTVEDAAVAGPYDFVLVCTKAFPNQNAALEKVISPQTAIVLAQNGIGIEEEWAIQYPTNTLISGVVWVPASPLAAGVVKMGSVERLEIGTYPASALQPAKQRVEELAGIWTRGGGHAVVSEDVQKPRWAKVAVNCAFNAMGALSRCDGANLLLSSEMADEMVVSVLREVGSVAAAVAGYAELASDDFIAKQMEWHRASRFTGGKESSMQIDAQAGRALEVEAIVGNVVRAAKQKGSAIPRLEMLYCLTRALDFSINKPADRWMPVNA